MSIRSCSALCTAVVLAWLAAGGTSAGQSLAELAKRSGKGSGRVLTNADLQPVEPIAATEAAPTPAPDAIPTPSEGSPAAKPSDAGVSPALEEPIKPRNKRPESYWRARAQDLQGRLAKVLSDGEALAARLQAIEAAPPTAASQKERAVVEQALTRERASETALRSEIAGFEARARAENVPAAWLR
jgi:hypothetical protein